LGAVQPDPGGAGAPGQLGVGGAVDVGQQLDAGAVGGDGLQVVVLDQQAGRQVGVLAMELAVGRLDLGAGVEVDVPLAAVQGDQVAGADLAHQALEAGDGGDAQAAGQDGGVPGGGPGLGQDA